jgi:D-arabinose 1-dehydrogenase-like Zn-dependent alcohol dehydrogenase
VQVSEAGGGFELGLESVAIARGTEKEPLSRELGAHHYIDSSAGDPAQALLELGGVDLILSTVTSPDAMAAVFGGLAAARESCWSSAPRWIRSQFLRQR